MVSVSFLLTSLNSLHSFIMFSKSFFRVAFSVTTLWCSSKSDHHMVRVKVRIGLPHQQKKRITLPFAVHTLHCKEQREPYQQALEEQLCNKPNRPDESTEHNWNTLKNSIVTAAEAVVEHGRKKQPDWFVVAADTLQPLLDAKKKSHDEVLQANNTVNMREFEKHQRIVKCHGCCQGRVD